MKLALKMQFHFLGASCRPPVHLLQKVAQIRYPGPLGSGPAAAGAGSLAREEGGQRLPQVGAAVGGWGEHVLRGQRLPAIRRYISDVTKSNVAAHVQDMTKGKEGVTRSSRCDHGLAAV